MSHSFPIDNQLLIICNNNSDDRFMLIDKISRTVHWVVEDMKHVLKVDLLKEDVVVKYRGLKLLVKVFIKARRNNTHLVELIDVEDMDNPSLKIVVDDRRVKVRRTGTFRRIPFGHGEVNFELAGDLLREQGYRGNFTVEMWNDGHDNPLETLEESLDFLKSEMKLER